MLKKCVFCGSEEVELVTKHSKGEKGRHKFSHYVKCHNCHARGAAFSCYFDEGEAKIKGNRTLATDSWNNAGRITE